jgi:signal transduction histidine kinase
MSLMTELLEEGQTKEGKECLLRLSAQIRRLQNLVQALLSLAKLESHTIRFESGRCGRLDRRSFGAFTGAVSE